MILQALTVAAGLMLMLQMMLFVMSPAIGLKAAYVDGWRKAGQVAAHLFQMQAGPDRWIGVAAFGTVGFYVVIGLALDIVAVFGH
ncbi:hypothetical protein [Burkholderia gladioli]|uniref:hypothetical protein n=1 Tax=Burkholderia gladioli TaxID=28095 RepID=UPI00163ED2C3|nr:hypothetical protein [Burkholderia gladioli]